MITIPFWGAELALALLWLAVRAALWIGRGRIDWRREALLLLLYVDFAILLRLTFFPMSALGCRVPPLQFDPASLLPLRINLIPFVRLGDYAEQRDLLLNCIGNVALFIPSGILLPLLFPKLDGFGKTLAAGALLSFAIELLQLPFAVRASDIDDLIMNSIGAALGYALLALCRLPGKKKRSVAEIQRESSET